MTYQEALKAGIIPPPDEEYAWELKSGALKRFTSEELVRELRERANRRMIEINSRVKK